MIALAASTLYSLVIHIEIYSMKTTFSLLPNSHRLLVPLLQLLHCLIHSSINCIVVVKWQQARSPQCKPSVLFDAFVTLAETEATVAPTIEEVTVAATIEEATVAPTVVVKL